jgi:hypothetical protein
MRGVRQAQVRGKSFAGRPWLTAEARDKIRETTGASALIASVRESAQTALPTLNHLSERFAAICQRQNHPVDAELCPAIVKLLAMELYANCRALNMPAEKLIAVTAHHGAIGPELIQEFRRFQKTPGIFRTAVVSHCSDPRGFLRQVGDTIDTLAADPEFARFRRTPVVFTTAAVHKPSDPHGFLREVAATIDTLAAEPEFRQLRKTPSLLTMAAVNYRSDPRGFLRSRHRRSPGRDHER